MTGIKKCDKKLLQSVAGITKCDKYYKVKRNSLPVLYKTCVFKAFAKFIDNTCVAVLCKQSYRL